MENHQIFPVNQRTIHFQIDSNPLKAAGGRWGGTPWENPKKYVGNREENDDWKKSDVLFPSENKN